MSYAGGMRSGDIVAVEILKKVLRGLVETVEKVQILKILEKTNVFTITLSSYTVNKSAISVL